MPLYFWLATILGAGLVFVRMLSQIALWQRKEYRWDRMLSVLATHENRQLLTWPLLAGILLVGVGWIAALGQRVAVAEGAGWLALTVFIGLAAYHIQIRGLARPDTTLKALLVIAASMLLTGVHIWISFVPVALVALQWATLVFFVPFLVALAIILVNIVAAGRKRSIIAAAAKRRRELKKLTVLGITGSYGKTSTKFFLQQLLQEQADVVVTKAHRNSLLPVAQDMLEQLNADTRTYVVEMGAYRQGEIAELAALTQPRLGLLTAIGNQHLALFGSRENILAAKWELIASLPVDGVAILNFDETLLRKKARGMSRKVVWFSMQAVHDELVKPDVYLQSAHYGAREVTGKLHLGTAEFTVTIPLASEALLGSAVAAAAGAYALGEPPEKIVEQLQQLKPFPRTMEVTTNSKGTVIIDDSYSANEQGVITAINHLARFTEKNKVIVLVPLIELGASADSAHEAIGRALAKSGATTIVYGDTYSAHVRKGAQAVRPDFSLEVILTPRQLLERATRVLRPDTVVLLEGRLPDVVRKGVLL